MGISRYVAVAIAASMAALCLAWYTVTSSAPREGGASDGDDIPAKLSAVLDTSKRLSREVERLKGAVAALEEHVPKLLSLRTPRDEPQGVAPTPAPLTLSEVEFKVSHPSKNGKARVDSKTFPPAYDVEPSHTAARAIQATVARDHSLKRVSIVMTVYPSVRPEYLYPNIYPCRKARCEVHYSTVPQEYGMTPSNQKNIPDCDLVVFYVNSNIQLGFYDPLKNPLGKFVMMVNNENLKLPGMEAGKWLAKMKEDEQLWESFHIVHSLERGSTIPFYYYHQVTSIKEVEHYLRKHPAYTYQEKVDFSNGTLLLFMSSHPGHSYNRFQLVHKLSKYAHIDFYSGKRNFNAYFANVDSAPNVSVRIRTDCHPSTWYHPSITLCFIRPYFFNLAMENSEREDYVTEKVYDPLIAGTVPVYKGAPNIQDFVPPMSIVLFDDFATPHALAYYLNCVARNSTLYEYYRAWRTRTSETWKRILETQDPLCDACEMIARNDSRLYERRGRIPRPQPLSPANRCNQRPFAQCLMPGSRLPEHYMRCP